MLEEFVWYKQDSRIRLVNELIRQPISVASLQTILGNMKLEEIELQTKNIPLFQCVLSSVEMI